MSCQTFQLSARISQTVCLLCRFTALFQCRTPQGSQNCHACYPTSRLFVAQLRVLCTHAFAFVTRCTSNKRLASEPPGHRGTVCGHGSLHVLYRNGPSSASGTQSENAWLPNVSEASHPPGPPVASPMICLAAGSLHRGAFDPGWRTSFRGCTLPGCSTKAQLGTAMENVHQ